MSELADNLPSLTMVTQTFLQKPYSIRPCEDDANVQSLFQSLCRKSTRLRLPDKETLLRCRSSLSRISSGLSDTYELRTNPSSVLSLVRNVSRSSCALLLAYLQIHAEATEAVSIDVWMRSPHYPSTCNIMDLSLSSLVASMIPMMSPKRWLEDRTMTSVLQAFFEESTSAVTFQVADTFIAQDFVLPTMAPCAIEQCITRFAVPCFVNANHFVLIVAHTQSGEVFLMDSILNNHAVTVSNPSITSHKKSAGHEFISGRVQDHSFTTSLHPN